jgi:penicillin-binding protein 1A
LKKLGITRLKKTCSLALGDQGLTPLEHTQNYAVFASGGLETHAYGIEEIRTLKGEFLYSHEREAQRPRKQLFSRKAVEELNTMMQAVVQRGTGRRTQLDYTYNVGKTGTSSKWRDGWFMGFTGEYVVGVWMGNDNFSPMARVTGGSFPAQAWHDFMAAAHDTDNIPDIPGIAPHPVQVAERARLAAALAQNTTADLPVPPPADSVKDMSTATREVLKRLSELLKDAPPLKPNQQPGQGRAEAPAAAPAQPSLASAANTDGTPRPEPLPAAPEPENTVSAGRDTDAVVPQ